MHRHVALCSIVITAALSSCSNVVDRRAVVARHDPTLTSVDTLGSLSVGNGGFAFTADVTGLQTFPEQYSRGVPLTTMSHWGWHSFADSSAQVRYYDAAGYASVVRDHGPRQASAEWHRANPHRLHLGTLGLDLGNCHLEEVTNIDQRLDLYRGVITSHFRAGGVDYAVQTACHPQLDLVSAVVVDRAHTPLLLHFPYPTGAHADDAANWHADSLHTTTLLRCDQHNALLLRQLDAAVYYVQLHWEDEARLEQRGPNLFALTPSHDRLRLSCLWSPTLPAATRLPLAANTLQASELHWQQWWTEGLAVDFGQSTDTHAKELERRIVLSQYLLGVNCCGPTPPAETGLTYNSWYGKFHLEMEYWHQSWLAPWGHAEPLRRTLSWYLTALPSAQEIARRQGYRGARWMKMTDPSASEAPSNVGSFLLWQQTHLLTLGEQLYEATHDTIVLRSLLPAATATADFLASYATLNDSTHRYELRGYIPAQETVRRGECLNSPYELAQWSEGLRLASLWQQRLGLRPPASWDEVRTHLSLPSQDAAGRYLPTALRPDAWGDSALTSDHPAQLMALGVLPPTPLIDSAAMLRTLKATLTTWHWERTWGWDLPMVAMCALRLGRPALALEVLNKQTDANRFLVNGHNHRDARLRCYLPANGALLTAIALLVDTYGRENGRVVGLPDGWSVRYDRGKKR